MDMDMVVKDLCPGLLDDYLAFFGSVCENDPWLNFREETLGWPSISQSK